MAIAFSDIHSGAEPATRELGEVVSQASFAHNLNQRGQDAGIIHTRSDVQHGWDAHSFADLSQSGSGTFEGSFRTQQAALGVGDGGAARADDQHVVLQQLASESDMRAVMGHVRVVASHDAHRAPQPAVDHGVVQGTEGAAIAAPRN